MNPFRLVNKTHKINGAWHNAYYNRPYSEILDEEIIREFTPLVIGTYNA